MVNWGDDKTVLMELAKAVEQPGGASRVLQQARPPLYQLERLFRLVRAGD